jgi:hypothetical protein
MSVKRVEIAGGEVRWVLDFYTREGRRVRKWFSRKTDADAMAAEVRRPDWILPTRIPTFESMGIEWLKSKTAHRAGHARNCEVFWRRHLSERWGRLRLDQIMVGDIEAWARALSADHAVTTVGGILSAASEIFKLAMRRGLWTKTNPFALAARPRPPAREIADDEEGESEGKVLPPESIYSVGEVSRLLAAAAPGLETVLLTTAFSTGLRRGELCALTWRAVQWEPSSLTVAKSLSWVAVTGIQSPGRGCMHPRPLPDIESSRFPRVSCVCCASGSYSAQTESAIWSSHRRMVRSCEAIGC